MVDKDGSRALGVAVLLGLVSSTRQVPFLSLAPSTTR